MLDDRSKGTVIHKNEKEWKGSHSGFGVHKHIRTLYFNENKITGIDELGDGQAFTTFFHCAPDVHVVEIGGSNHSVLLSSNDVSVRLICKNQTIQISDNDVYSAGYGILQQTMLLSISGKSPVEWSIEIV